ncbi:beta-1,3-galactosyltransferase, putative [Pediculus humanus corporis]|uniref:Hexosyltransferase n=1 Tax=Pediculus humanus subsp. corporis TaxID=121224 RepID=E0W1S4_PEDHC|nr:beta-1,3-galactosyltransferase, putative [Pediculus humanus corporis]EEB19656.1 beta-1,3-galactosyltransferase, putative [Pediculus humanus corporis]
MIYTWKNMGWNNNGTMGKNDFTRLVNLDDFKFLKNTFSCDSNSNNKNNTNPTLLILIHTAPNNFEKRKIIRDTWGSIVDSRYRLLFLLGLPDTSSLQHKLDKENESHGDIVQGNFVDAYRNLTYKHVMALKWTKYFCPNVKYLLKTDDDVFVNVPKFLNYIDDPTGDLPKTHLMRCLPEYKAIARRSNRSKWKVTTKEYQYRHYPPFCQGFSIMYSYDVVKSLYSLAQRSKFFWIDDVLITGFLGMVAGFTPSSFGRLMMSRKNLYKVSDRDWDVVPYLLGPCNLQETDIKKLWDKLNYKSFK